MNDYYRPPFVIKSFYKLFIGRDILMPLDLKLPGNEAVGEGETASKQDYVNNLHLHLSQVFDSARANSLKAALKRKDRLDKAVKIMEFREGQKVWLRSSVTKPGQSAKWSAGVVGPFKIVKSIGKANYIVQRLCSGKKILVHADRLRADTSE